MTRSCGRLGLAGTVLYGAAIVWMYAAQPQTMAEVTGGFTSTIGAYASTSRRSMMDSRS